MNKHNTEIEKYIPLIDVACGKKAIQSSLSKFSKPDDASRALNSNLKVDFAFHTDSEKNPWWIVDLEKVHAVELIKVTNRRREFQNRARTLRVEVSVDKREWNLVHSGKLYWGNEIVFNLASRVLARYVRISLDEKSYLHLSRVQVLAREYPGLVVAARNDGLGSRLMAMLNGLYFADKLGFNFAFVWEEKATEWQAKQQKPCDAEVLGRSIETKNDIFSREFIDKYSANGLVPIGGGVHLNASRSLSLDELRNPANFEKIWGFYAPANLKNVFPECLSKKLKKCWNKIDFNKNIENLLIYAASEAKKLGNFFAVHIRTGDIVFGDSRMYNEQNATKAFPVGLADKVIKKFKAEGRNIIVFSDEISVARFLKNKHQIETVEDFFPERFLNSTEKALFEMRFMSFASTIIASGISYFSLMARTLGDEIIFKSIYTVYSEKEQYQILKNYVGINDENVPLLIRAFDCFHCYLLGLKIKTNDDLQPVIEKALMLDIGNPKYIIYLIDILVKKGLADQAEFYLQNKLSSTEYPILNNLMKVLVSTNKEGYYFYSLYFKSFEFGMELSLPCLSFVYAKILEKVGSKNEAAILREQAKQMHEELKKLESSAVIG